ncbi:MAG: MraY family glycosyltransferase [bacterium]|nr:MraY family glycosyltransferase [bacterium]
MMTFLIYMALPTFFIALLGCVLFTPVAKRLSNRFHIHDHPSERKMHDKSLPLLGGIALYLSVSLSLIAHLPFDSTLFTILAGATFATLLGIWDDIYGSWPYIKLAIQVCIAIFTVKMGITISFLPHPFTAGILSHQWVSIPLTVLWIVGIMNTFNLIDGLDGLAAGVGGISAGFLALIAVQQGHFSVAVFGIAISGACLGFLRYNFSPAQIFMGDTGAMFLGYMLSVVSIIGVMKSNVAISLLIPILVLGIPISDTLFAIIRRVKNGQAIFKPDTEHVHHKLIGKGFSARQATLVLYSLSALLGALALGISLPLKFASLYLGLAAIAIGVTASVMYRRRGGLF